MTTLFNTTQNEQNEDTIQLEEKDYLTELVGEGKKFKDTQALAKGKATSDAFINQLLKEKADLLTELKSRKTVQELLTDRNSNPPPPVPVQPEDNGNEPDLTNTKDLETLLERKLTEREQASVKQRNLSIVKEKLQEVWGDKYALELRTAASQLGLGEQFLDNLASEQPAAFFKLVGIDAVAQRPVQPLPNNSRPSERTLSNKPQIRGFSYWEAERRKQGDNFWNPKNQLAMWQDIQKYGETEFYNS